MAQKLEHPNTVRIYEYGLSDDGLPYIAFQLLRGRPLDRVIAEEAPLSPERVARITRQTLNSLMEAHELGIVHRDIKPENIVLSDFQGELDFVKVLDFGVAKSVLDSSTQSGHALTARGEVLGTPRYMAPEQVRGEAVSPASDLYALGLIMGEMLTGHPVVDGSSIVEVCDIQLSDAPLPLDAAIMSSPLAKVIATATQKNREDRYSFAGEMLADIDHALNSQPAPSLKETTDAFADTLLALQTHNDSTNPPTPPAGESRTQEHLESPPQSPRQPKRLTLIVAAVAFGGLLFFALAAFAGVFIARSRDHGAPQHALSMPRTPTPPVQATSAPPVPSKSIQPPPPQRQEPPPLSPEEARIESLTTERIRASLERSSWELRNVTSGRGTPGVTFTSFNVSRNYQTGVILFYQSSDHFLLETVSENMRHSYDIVRLGRTKLLCMIVRGGRPEHVDRSPAEELYRIITQ